MNRAFSRKKDKTWMHTPEALSKHFIPYNAKFLGSTEVEQPKGTEVVRDAVRKLKEVQHNCQLHRISFCADDKTDKRIFTFICKDSESNKHLCYVFDSEKCAEEITLTIGQAFDLAYRKFLESGGKDVETRKQIAGLQKRNLVFSCDFASLPDASHGDQSSRSSRCWIQDLETENMELKNKVQDLENQLRITQVSTPPLLHKMSGHEQHGFQRCSSSFWRSSGDSSPCLNISSISVTPVNSPDSRLSLGLLIPPPSKCGFPKPVSESSIPRPHVGSMTPKSPSTDIFDMIPFSPTSHQSSIPTRNGTQPPPVPSRSSEIKRDLFGAEPFDPFNCGAADFPPDIQSKLDEMQEGFKMGLTLEGTVFCLDPLDSRC
ncbi:PTB domain-containing engulfment adapter protein 1 isoform X4 [Aotus nancymaae]|uniref:PTB domain-containing engulfment adapter protein 1 isoform X4 n=1 Tax=Aotus nancymaae TaxID=37293 RepID=UPI0030FE17B2